MDNAGNSKDVFNMPLAPRSPREDGMSLSVKTPSSRAGSKKRVKTRAKSRGKPTSQETPSSIHLSSSTDLPDSSGTAMDADLNEMIADLAGMEQRVTQILASLQKEVSAAANFMLDSIMAEMLQGVDVVRSKIPEIHKRTQANRAATTSLQSLDGIDRA